MQEAKDQAEQNELLIWAAARGLLADAVELIARGAEPQVRDKQGLVPAHYAAAHGHLDLLQYLATKGADLEAEDPQGRMPLHHAVVSGSIEVLRFLIQRSTWLDAADGADDTALHLAARRGWAPGIKLLLAGAASPNIPNKRGLSALGEAVAGGHTAAAEVLLQAGADTNCRAAGYTLLHIAAGMGHKDVLQLLLQQPGSSAFINDALNGDLATPLHAAAMAGSAACVQLLLQQGADAGLAGAQGLMPWQVAAADTAEVQQQLGQQLKDAAGSSSSHAKKAGVVPASSSAANSKDAAAAAARARADSAAAARPEASSPTAAYAVQFAGLNAAEQGRKVDTFARMSEQELGQLDFLSAEARQAISQVRRAQQLLTCYRAVAALRIDESFQEDASEPAVQAALHEMALANSFEKYKGERHIMAVAAKLKKFHSVMQECGMRLGLQDVLVKPGQTLAQLMEQDAQQVQGLTAAAAAARNAAVAAIAGWPAATPAAGAAAGGAVAAAAGDAAMGRKTSAAASAEIQPAAPADAADAELDLDLQLQQAQAAAAAEAAAAARSRGLKPLEEMSFWERMRYEVLNSFKQAVKIMCMVFVLWGVMWCFGLMPYQQDPLLLEQRMQQMAQARQQQQQQGVAAGGGHTEL